jgi:unsaturated rhamnogalacturonyl hydrolase
VYKLWLAFLLGAMPALAQNQAQKIVALDGFHNNESKMPDHYQWDGVRPGGFSELGKLLTGLGAQLKTVRERVTPAVLAGVKVFIIVDPDTPAETDNPQYIMPDEIAAMEQWVRGGGRLVLLGNDKGNAEFEHFNQLAKRFGIEFLEETYPKVQGKGILIARGDTPIFAGAPEVYLVEVAPLKVAADVKILLAQAGKGEVFALGDPWVYNEYMDHKDNRTIATNLFRDLLR